MVGQQTTAVLSGFRQQGLFLVHPACSSWAGLGAFLYNTYIQVEGDTISVLHSCPGRKRRTWEVVLWLSETTEGTHVGSVYILLARESHVVESNFKGAGK